MYFVLYLIFINNMDLFKDMFADLTFNLINMRNLFMKCGGF